jgi:hypothetical protein
MNQTQTLGRNVRIKALSIEALTTRKNPLPAELIQVSIGQILGDCGAYRSSTTANTRLEWSFGQPYMMYAT